MHKLFKKFYKFNVNAFGYLRDIFIGYVDGFLFATLFNFKLRLKGVGDVVGVESVGIDGRYLYNIKSTAAKVVFFHKFQALRAYNNGLISRSKELAECYMLDLIQFNALDLVVDCGANVGDFNYFVANNINISYIPIEPSPLEYECLVKNTIPIISYNCGLWYEDTHLPFYIDSNFADSSFIQTNLSKDVIGIPARRLSSLIDRPIKLLKIDAEGAEPEVILGASQIFDKIEWIAADLGYERGVTSDCTFVDVTNILLANDFSLIKFNEKRMTALYRNKKFCK